MQKIKVFELTYNSDSCEGRGHTLIAARFRNKRDAETVAQDERFYKKFCVMGICDKSGHNVREAEYTILDSAAEFFDDQNEQLRQQALRKLSAEERRALGL